MSNITKGIETIIFDLGGVILDIDPQKTMNAFKNLVSTDFASVYKELTEMKMLQNLETGKITFNEFANELNKFSSNPALLNDIKNAWNAMIIDIPENRIRLLEKLKKQYSIYLLSNTNSIHQEKFHGIVKQKYNLDFRLLFTKAYYSHELGLRKPGIEIYQYVLNDSKIKPSTALFLDDYIENLENAKKLGIQCYQVNEKEEICNLFSEKRN